MPPKLVSPWSLSREHAILTSMKKTLRKRKANPEPQADGNVKRSKTVDALATPFSTPEKAANQAPSVQIPVQDTDFGTNTAIKIFYEGKRLPNGTINWVETRPRQPSAKVAKANNRFAIKVFKVKDYEQATINGETPLRIQSVQVQSARLVAALEEIVKDEGMHLETTETAKFDAPFKPLFFSYDKILTLGSKKHEDALLTNHSALLLQVMNELFGGIMMQLKHLKSSGLITYKLAWTYFPKGSKLFCGTTDSERVCRVTSTSYQCGQFPHLLIQCEEIAFDGESFAWKPVALKIPPFNGNLPVIELPCYPLEFHEAPEGVSERLTTRAKKILNYQELTYCEYTGVGLLPTPCGIQKHNVCCHLQNRDLENRDILTHSQVSGRILIDYFGYSKHQEGLQRNDSGNKRTRGNGAKAKDANEESTYVKRLPREKQEENRMEMLGDREKDLIFLSPMLKGFALKNKLWREL